VTPLFRQTIQLYKDSYSGHPKQVWALTILTMINRMGTMVIPFLTVYLTTVLDFPLKDAGILASAFGFGSLAGSYLGGRLSDKFGSTPVIIVSLLLSGLLLIILQSATQFHSLFALILITGMFGEAYRPALMSAIGEYVPKKQTGRSLALIRMAINVGMTAGPAAGGFIAASLSYSWLFWIDGITCIAAALYFAYTSRNWKKQKETNDPGVPKHIAEQALPPQKNRRYLIFLLATFLSGFAFVQIFTAIPVFIKDEWGFDERYIGTLIAMSSFMVLLIEMPAVHAVERAGSVKPSILIGLALMGLSFIPFLLPKALILCFIAIFIFTLGEILYLPFNNSIALNMSPDGKRGSYMAWYWMTWSMTRITAPIVGLGFADAFGFSAFWVLLVLIVAISFEIYRRLTDRILAESE
jgi:MFS family permease